MKDKWIDVDQKSPPMTKRFLTCTTQGSVEVLR
jgi:hypothetical protein